MCSIHLLSSVRTSIFLHSFDVLRNKGLSVLESFLVALLSIHSTYLHPSYDIISQAFRKDIDKLERIQRKATKMISKLWDLSYEKRLKECGLTPLKTTSVELFPLSTSIPQNIQQLPTLILYALVK